MKVNLKFEFAKFGVATFRFNIKRNLEAGTIHPFLAHRACKFLHIYRL